MKAKRGMVALLQKTGSATDYSVDWADAERIALRHQGTDPETWSRKWRSAEEAIEALKAVKK